MAGAKGMAHPWSAGGRFGDLEQLKSTADAQIRKKLHREGAAERPHFEPGRSALEALQRR